MICLLSFLNLPNHQSSMKRGHNGTFFSLLRPRFRKSVFLRQTTLPRLARPTDALALERLLNQDINYSDIADQFLWESVADPQVGGAGRTDPDPTILTRPDERFEGQIKG